MFFNILNYVIFNGKLSSIDKFSIRRIRDAFAYYECDEKTDIAQMTFKPKYKTIFRYFRTRNGTSLSNYTSTE